MFEYWENLVTGSFFVLISLYISIVDWKTLRIPNSALLGILFFAVFRMGLLLFFTPEVDRSHWFGTENFATAGGVLALGFVATRFLPRSLGFGDVKLLSVWALVFSPFVVLLGLWIASILGIIYYVMTKSTTKGKAIPFGPFLSLGIGIAFGVGSRVFALMLGK